MFEKDAEKSSKKAFCIAHTHEDELIYRNGFQQGAEFGYNKAREERKQAFLEGLKAGRPQWHDLRKDKNDLPKVKKGTSCTPVIILDSNKYFSVAHYCKGTISGAFMIDGRQWETIAWCEIPTFDKE